MDKSRPSTSQASQNKEKDLKPKIIKTEVPSPPPPPDIKNFAEPSSPPPDIKHFQCENCLLKLKYEYFGQNPPFMRWYILLEDAYVIEDPFVPPKKGQFIVVGSHCIKCRRTICKSSNCSIYFDGTYCISCAKSHSQEFPQALQEKLNAVLC